MANLFPWQVEQLCCGWLEHVAEASSHHSISFYWSEVFNAEQIWSLINCKNRGRYYSLFRVTLAQLSFVSNSMGKQVQNVKYYWFYVFWMYSYIFSCTSKLNFDWWNLLNRTDLKWKWHNYFLRTSRMNVLQIRNLCSYTGCLRQNGHIWNVSKTIQRKVSDKNGLAVRVLLNGTIGISKTKADHQIARSPLDESLLWHCFKELKKLLNAVMWWPFFNISHISLVIEFHTF